MFIKILFTILISVSLLTSVWYVLFSNNLGTVEPGKTGIESSLPVTTTEDDNNRKPGTILTISPGVIISDTAIISNSNATIIEDDFYELTDNLDVFGIYYASAGGNMTVMLYDEDTKQARLTAEKYLLSSLPYTKEQLCSVFVNVLTNQYVNPALSGINLGFSFCPGSVEL